MIGVYKLFHDNNFWGKFNIHSDVFHSRGCYYRDFKIPLSGSHERIFILARLNIHEDTEQTYF